MMNANDQKPQPTDEQVLVNAILSLAEEVQRVARVFENAAGARPEAEQSDTPARPEAA